MIAAIYFKKEKNLITKITAAPREINGVWCTLWFSKLSVSLNVSLQVKKSAAKWNTESKNNSVEDCNWDKHNLDH